MHGLFPPWLMAIECEDGHQVDHKPKAAWVLLLFCPPIYPKCPFSLSIYLISDFYGIDFVFFLEITFWLCLPKS